MTELSAEFVSNLGLTSYGSKTVKGSGDSDELGQSDFLNLMITQLTNQDPTSPVENEDFIAQLAQFSTVSGIEELNSAFDNLSQTLNQGQTLQAAALVGKKALVPTDVVELAEGQGATGAVDLASPAGRVTVDIYGASGQLVRNLDLGGLNAGLQEFSWDGLLDDGTPAPAGSYEFRITSQTNGVTEAQTTLIDADVKSVALDKSSEGLILNVSGLGKISFSDVYRVG